jgi:lipoate-protein ligase A
MVDDMDAESYLDNKINKILKLDISKKKKIKKMVKFIKNNFEIKFPPYSWTKNKTKKLKEKLEDMFDFNS